MAAFESTETEEAAQEWPQVRDIGENDCCGCFACIPVQVDETAVAGGEVVVPIQNCCKDLF